MCRSVGFLAVALLVAGVGESWGAAGVTLKAGTLGVGADVTIGLTEQLNVRVGGSYFSYTFRNLADDGKGEVSNVEDLDAKVDLQSASLLLDLHPWKSPFRITGGVIIHNNEFSATADTGQRVEIGDRVYTVSDTKGTVTFENEIAPYVGIGYGNAVRDDSRWHFALDIGVVFHGKPQVDLIATANDPFVQAFLDRDIERQIAESESDLKDFTMYPVFSVGISYRF